MSKGKHVFMEKPVAVDAVGVRQVLAAAEEAKKKNLKVGVGLQRHHQQNYIETVAKIQEGYIGKVIAMRVYWNNGGVWVRPRQPGQSEMEYQMRNWYYFNWLCGDHICEQHIHNLDVCNWVVGDYPISANGQGGRCTESEYTVGEIFDHHFIEYTYANGVKMWSQCRHIGGCWNEVAEYAHGTTGQANLSGLIQPKGGQAVRAKGGANPYQVEHDDLFAAIRSNTPYNEAENGAKSSMTSILGRMATYGGKIVSWNDALNSKIALTPANLAWDADMPVKPNAEGRYPLAMPGKTTVV